MTTSKGQLALQTMAMPADTNPSGDIFGGWLVSQMDLAAGIIAKRLAKGRIATVAINSMSFVKPVRVGDVVSCYIEVLKVGKTSITLAVEAWARPAAEDLAFLVAQGTIVSVAIDEQGRPRVVSGNSA